MRKREYLPQIKLSDAQKKKLNEEIKAFYLDERGEEIGMIEQMQLLELFQQKMAPIVYNKALDVVQADDGECRGRLLCVV